MKTKGNKYTNWKEKTFKKPEWLEELSPVLKNISSQLPDLRSESGKGKILHIRTYPEIDKIVEGIKEKYPRIYKAKSELHRKAHYIGVMILKEIEGLEASEPFMKYLLENESKFVKWEQIERLIEHLNWLLEKYQSGIIGLKECQKTAKKAVNVTLLLHRDVTENKKIRELMLQILDEDELKKLHTRLRVRKHREKTKNESQT